MISDLKFGTVLWKLRIMESFVTKYGVENYSCEHIIIMRGGVVRRGGV